MRRRIYFVARKLLSLLAAGEVCERLARLTQLKTLQKPIADTFRKIVLGKKSGALICETKDSKRLIFFNKGEIIGSRSDAAAERLGRILLSEGRLTKDQLKKATEYIRSGKKIGEIMVKLGYLKPGEIENFIRLQVRNIAAAMLVAQPTRVVFTKKLGIQRTTPQSVGLAEIFMQAVSSLEDPAVYLERFKGKLISLTEDEGELPDDLDSERAAVLDALNLMMEPTSLDDLIESTGQELAPTIAVVAGLLEAEQLELSDAAAAVSETEGSDSDAEQALADELLVRDLDLDVFAEEDAELHEEGVADSKDSAAVASSSEQASESDKETDAEALVAPPEELRKQVEDLHKRISDGADHWGILGLERGASKAEILQAFHRLCGDLHPDLHQSITVQSFHATLGSVFARVTDAFQTLSQEAKANDYQKLVEKEGQYEETGPGWTGDDIPDEDLETGGAQKDPEQAKQLFARAKRAFIEADYWNTIQLCRNAIELGDNDPEYYYILGQALAQNPRWRQDAEKNLKIATKLEPWTAKYFVALGDLYSREGMENRAKRMFSEARTIDPDVKLPKSATESQDAGSEIKAFGVTLPLGGKSKAG